MIQWKMTAVSFAVGAVATVGFVWLRRSLARRAHQQADSAAPFDAEAAARSDALHDVADSELDFVETAELDAEVEPTDLLSFEQEMFERETAGERYDAVDPEEVGTEWLQRATEAAAVDSVPGSTAEPPAIADIAAELPVGTIDEGGNTELHGPGRPPTPPAELSPTDEELVQRRKAHEEHTDPGKRHE